MSGWRKCDTCRKVRQVDEFDDGSPTCRSCLTAPAPKRRAASPVTRTTVARPAAVPAAPAPAAPRRPLLGSVGAGDLEVRERRAKRAALDALAQSHPDEFAVLLRDARRAEGLRPLAQEDRVGQAGPGDQEPVGAADETGDGQAEPEQQD